MIYSTSKRIPKKLKNYLSVLFLITSINLLSAESFHIFKADGYYGLKNTQGDIIIPPQYDQLGWSNDSTHIINGVIGYKKHSKWGIITTKNKKLTPARYASIAPFNKSILLASQPHPTYNLLNYGLITTKAKIILSFDFAAINSAGDFIMVKKYTGFEYDFRLFTVEGINTGIKAEKITVLGNTFILEEKGKKIVLNHQLDTINLDVPDSLQLVNESIIYWKNGIAGLLSKNGNMLLERKYEQIETSDFPEVSAIPAPLVSYYDKNMSPVDTLKYEEFIKIIDADKGSITEQNIIFRKGNYFGIRNNQLEELLPPVFDSIMAPCNPGYKAIFRGSYGIVDLDGHWVFPPQKFPFTYLGDSLILIHHSSLSLIQDLNGNVLATTDGDFFLTGHFIFHQQDSVWMVSSKNGDFLFEDINYWVEMTDDKVLVVNANGAYTLEYDGNVVFLRKLLPDEVIISYEGGYFMISQNRQFGFTDEQLRLRIANRYDSLKYFSEGRSPFLFNGKWGYINERDRIAIQPYYDSVGCFKNGLAIVKNQGKYGLIDIAGEEVVPLELDLITRSENYFLVKEGDKMGLLSESGEQLLFSRYDYLNPAGNWVIVRKRGKYGIITPDGRPEVPVIYREIVYRKEAGFYMVESTLPDTFHFNSNID